MTLRILIADDEPLAREALRDALASVPGTQLVTDCADGVEALDAIHALRPDLALLDIQMPGLDGLEVAAALDASTRPALVFVTAYDEHAVRAFDLHAVDYVLKPYDPRRLAAAIERARHVARDSRLDALIESLRPARHAERFVVVSTGRTEVAPVADVEWIGAEGNYVTLNLATRQVLHREPLKSVLARLDPARFARVHRSAAVNLDCIRELRPLPNGDYRLLLRSGAEVSLSRSHRDALLERLQ